MIPVEMTHYPAWVVWRFEDRGGPKPTKVPYNPRTLLRASVTEPSNWATYYEAMSLYQSGHGGFAGVGFVLSRHDPYCIIDLDDPKDDQEAIERARKVLETFDTYTEISQSGQGLHLILRGTVPSGKRKGKIEVYSSERFFALTGNTYREQHINECDYFLQHLWHELAGSPFDLQQQPNLSKMSQPQTIPDAEVYERASKSYESFVPLWMGKWQEYYGSHSEADLALINMIGFFSRNAEQIQRMFWFSELGKRPKAKRKDYVTRMIEKSFDNMLPNISLDDLMGNLHVQIEVARQEEVAKKKSIYGEEGITFPDGLVGEICDFVYRSAPHPVKEIALAAGISAMAGICGRAYNVGTAGLNLYTLLLAGTGRGKEAARSGITKLMERVVKQFPQAECFIGPGDIASGQGLIKQLNATPCFLSILGEFGLTLQQMGDKYSPPHLKSLQKVMLDLYAKSGFSQSLSPTAYSERDKNTATVHSPNLSILGETTPDSFYPNLTETMVASGLIPRFLCIEYNGPRVDRAEGYDSVEPSKTLMDKLVLLCQICLTLTNKTDREVVPIAQTADAEEYIREFGRECTRKINASEDNRVIGELWNRAELKLLKVAGGVAVGQHFQRPTITLATAKWAERLIVADITNMIRRFDTGAFGDSSKEQSQANTIRRVVKDYVYRPFDSTLEKYAVKKELHQDRVLPWTFISRRLIGLPDFKGDRMGSTFAIKRAVDMLIAEGTLVEVNAHVLKDRYQYTGKAYFVSSLRQLD